MPAIKKKWMKTSREDGSIMDDNSLNNEGFDDEEKEQLNPEEVSRPVVEKPRKRAAPTEPGMLKGLDGEVLLEKRKRFIPAAELKLTEWLDNNLEKRTEETVSLPALYKFYTDLCQTDGSEILDVPEFNRMIRVKFGKTFGVQSSSVYKTLIKERKMGEKKKGTLGGVKWKDIMIEAINHFGNPWQGVRFFNLKSYISTRCPALQIDSKPKILKRALENGTRSGYIDLARGVGMAGCYRLPGAVEPPPKPKNKGKTDTEGEAKSEEDQSKEDNPDKEQSDDVAKNETTVKQKKPKKIQAWSYSKISYSNPAKVEDTFPLAITYQSAPKAAGVARIRRYIQEQYGEEVTDGRWRKTVESGLEKSYWEHVSGSGLTGRIHLLMDDFDPNSEQLEDRICAAIIACHDPKSASCNQMKKYVTKYHADFAVDQYPDRFKKALQRAVDKKMIRQLSGLGASGTFQLVVPFTPSPSVLAGDDDSEAEEELDKEEQAYVPRGTKSRGIPKKESKKSAAVTVAKKAQKAVGKSEVQKSKNHSKKPAGRGRGRSVERRSGGKNKGGRKRSLSPLTDEEDMDHEQELEYTPRKSQSRGGDRVKASPATAKKGSAKKPAPKMSRKKPVAAASDSEEEDDEEDLVVEYTPRKTASRGNTVKSPQNGSKSASARKGRGDDSDEEDSAEFTTPKKSTPKARGGNSSSRKSTGKKNRR